jgi:hypothetical protein
MVAQNHFSLSVVPAHADIQSFRTKSLSTHLDARFHGHDDIEIWLMAINLSNSKN